LAAEFLFSRANRGRSPATGTSESTRYQREPGKIDRANQNNLTVYLTTAHEGTLSDC